MSMDHLRLITGSGSNIMKKQFSFSFISILILLSYSTLATEQENGDYVWQFLSGQAWPIGYEQNIGKPENLLWSASEYTTDFFARINNALPESESNEAFSTDDCGSIVDLDEEGEVFVTFVHEGTDYKNAFGFFTFDRNNPPQSSAEVMEIIIFPNLSSPHMASGHRLSLGTFPAGTSIGFLIAANGFDYYTGVKTEEIPYYYSLQYLNPEEDPTLRQHTVLLYDEEVGEVILGFEDLPGTWGDNDFNDAVFSIKTSPGSAIHNESLTKVPDVNDSDADGLIDSLDEFPDDYRRAYSTYFPSQTEFVTLAYEDNWPRLGDYDFNDLVVKERFQTTYDASGLVSGFIIQGFISARGGSKANGFALRLVDIPASQVEYANLQINNITYDKKTESNQTDAVISLWGNSKVFTDTGEAGQCSLFNTNKNCAEFSPVEFTFDLRFTNGLLSLNHSVIDFFIYRSNDRTLEIHMPGYAPTDWFNFARFGTADDTSNVSQERYFRSTTNLPWGLKISDNWDYPREYIDVLWAYPDYEQWVESSGSLATAWYKTSERTSHFYVPTIINP
jgi:LruC domain-containing protein